MDKIKNDTLDINPNFWKDFESNRLFHNKLVSDASLVTMIDCSKFEKKRNLADFCDILIYLIDSVEVIYNKKLSSYLDILGIMCVYSCLIRELNFFENLLKNDGYNTYNLVEEFIDLFNNFENVLSDDNLGNLNISSEINESKSRTRKLYLKVIQSISLNCI